MLSEYMVIAILYISGIVVSKHFDMSAAFSVFLGILVTAIICTFRKKPKALGIAVLSFVFLFGAVRYFYVSQNRLFYEFPDKYVTITGTVVSPPDAGDGQYKYRYILMPETVSYLDKTAHTDDKILLHTKARLSFGDRITASGFLSEVDGRNNEHEPDYRLYYMGRGIFARFVAREIHSATHSDSLSPDLLLGGLACAISDIIDLNFTGNSAAFLKAILLGDKSGFSADYYTTLIKTGVSRTLYTPFVHISLIFLLAGIFSKDKKGKNISVLFLFFIYCILNMSSPTIVKAASVCIFLLLRKQLLGFAGKPDIIAKTVLIMTVIDPLLLFHSGFLMSVASSVVLYFSYTPVYRWLLRKFGKVRKSLQQNLAKLMSLWIIFLFGTLPVCIYLFGGVSVYATLFMTIATPVIMLILVLSPVMLISFGLLGASPIIAPVIKLCLDFIAFLPVIAEQLPAYYITLKTPTICDIVSFYLVWWMFIRFIKGKSKTPETAVIFLTVLGIFLSSLPFSDYNTLSVYFVNVGQGDGAILHTSLGETVLIDGGGSADYEDNYNIGERVFVPYLTSHGFTDIDVAILSHYHKDHAEGIIAALNSLKINTVVMPGIDPGNTLRTEIEKTATEKGTKIEYLGITDEILFDSGLKIRFVAPTKAQRHDSDPNDSSLVAHVTYGEFSALFTGDSKDKLNDLYPKDVDLLKVSHHGSDTGTSREFLDAVNPEYAVISVGEDNSYNLPSDNVVARLLDKDINILRTDKQGDIRFKVKKDGSFTYKTLKGE